MAREKLETLTEQMYYLLLALCEPGHGYAVMERVEKLSHGRLRLGPGTLYTLLGRFEREKLIRLDRTEDTRKIYCLTAEGGAVLREEHERLRRQLADGEAILGKEGGHEGQEVCAVSVLPVSVQGDGGVSERAGGARLGAGVGGSAGGQVPPDLAD